MVKDPLTPTQASGRLNLTTAQLRKFVSLFPHLFSSTALLSTNRRYTEADIAVFRRVRQSGDQVSIGGSSAARPRQPGAQSPTVGRGAGDVAAQLKLVLDQLSGLEVRIRLDYLALSDRLDRLDQTSSKLIERIKLWKHPSRPPGGEGRLRRGRLDDMLSSKSEAATAHVRWSPTSA